MGTADLANNGYGGVALSVDAEGSPRVVWRAQAACDGLAWACKGPEKRTLGNLRTRRGPANVSPSNLRSHSQGTNYGPRSTDTVRLAEAAGIPVWLHTRP